jgi:organic radical activating enzyme
MTDTLPAVEFGFSVPRVTTRAMIDPTRLCALRCEFCYYLPQDDFHTVKPWAQQQDEVLRAAARHCDSCDITGGEPLQNPHIVELVRLCVEKGVYPRIITSLICAEKTFDGVLDAGVADWLISMHGAKAETHDAIVHIRNARSYQVRRLAKIAARMRYCANYVLIEKNQAEMADWARWLLALDHAPPKVVNFINFNPHYGWGDMMGKAAANVVDLRVCGPVLDEAIDLLEEAGVGVNVRYYPMCGLAERHRKSICNDLHVAFDFGEWDNAITSRSRSDGEQYGSALSMRNELHTGACASCGNQLICGGANRVWHELAVKKFGGEVLTPIALPVLANPGDFWFYRKENRLGLDPRR